MENKDRLPLHKITLWRVGEQRRPDAVFTGFFSQRQQLSGAKRNDFPKL
jgi:hypothetical protein